MSEIKAYLFDMDGTLADSEAYYVSVTYDMLKEMGKERSRKEIASHIVGGTMEDVYGYLSGLLGVSKEEAERINTAAFERRPMRYRDYLFPDALKVVRTVKERGYRTALCTVNSRANMEDFLSCGFRDLFDFTVCWEDGIKEKPDPDVYLRALKALDVNRDEVIIIEDSYNGVRAGKAAGAYVIGCHIHDLGNDLSMADKVIENLIELI
ncbi:MAG: HAD family phosphatase [Erysipelotrichaceae bacterium]|nr:HAD family phosphatase [Erysipelotrichaceae bacterium]